MKEIEEIIDIALNGNWDEATERFKALDLYNSDYEMVLEDLNQEELIVLATIGYYARIDNE